MKHTVQTIITSTLEHLSPLLLSLIFASIVLATLSFNNILSQKLKRKSLRFYINTQYILISTIALFTITVIYWLIDTQLFALNIPIQPYIFFTLIITIFFGYKVGLLANLSSTILIMFYLYEPRYVFNPFIHPEQLILTALSLSLSVFVGNLLRNYQRKLIFESDQLKALIKARDQFTSVAAHDLRTPLAVIKLYLQSMLKSDQKATSKEAKKSLKNIDIETDKLIELINSLFDFSRLENNKMVLHKKKGDIVTLCRSTTQKMSKIHQTHHFNFISKKRHISLMADYLALERVMTNLLTNAVKYSPVQSTIKVFLTSNQRSVTIGIRDRGKGIPQEIQKKLFDPFFQSTESNFGLGLGLYIAKSLVKLHEGKIWLDSTLNKGTTFYICLPLLRH